MPPAGRDRHCDGPTRLQFTERLTRRADKRHHQVLAPTNVFRPRRRQAALHRDRPAAHGRFGTNVCEAHSLERHFESVQVMPLMQKETKDGLQACKEVRNGMYTTLPNACRHRNDTSSRYILGQCYLATPFEALCIGQRLSSQKLVFHKVGNKSPNSS